MESINSLKELYLEFIRDIYHAEVLLIPELRFFTEKTSSEQLKSIIQNHLSATHSHTSRLEEIQVKLNANMLQGHCRTMKSMIIETKELVEQCSNEKMAERAMVASLHRITHCMITVYQMLVSMADELELPKQKQVLEKNMHDEIIFDKKISAYGFNTLFQEFNLIKKLS